MTASAATFTYYHPQYLTLIEGPDGSVRTFEDTGTEEALGTFRISDDLVVPGHTFTVDGQSASALQFTYSWYNDRTRGSLTFGDDSEIASWSLHGGSDASGMGFEFHSELTEWIGGYSGYNFEEWTGDDGEPIIMLSDRPGRWERVVVTPIPPAGLLLGSLFVLGAGHRLVKRLRNADDV